MTKTGVVNPSGMQKTRDERDAELISRGYSIEQTENGRIIHAPTKPRLETYTAGSNDNPTTCPKCGARTDNGPSLFECGVQTQVHECLGCSYKFKLEI